MPLTDSAIRNAKPGAKPIRMFDGGGLDVAIAPSGGKWWRLKYRFEGREKRLSLGVYPDVPLASGSFADDGATMPVPRHGKRSVPDARRQRGTAADSRPVHEGGDRKPARGADDPAGCPRPHRHH